MLRAARAEPRSRSAGLAVDAALLQYVSRLGWEHINRTGDYPWYSSAKIGAGKFRPLRPRQAAWRALQSSFGDDPR
ncbi:MAG: hypothetical protein AMXMBFR6_01960 [Betaproteobacteria bacterium]